MTAQKTASLFLSIIITLSLCNIVTERHSAVSPVACAFGDIINDVRETVNGIREGINGVVRFVDTITGMARAVASLAGIRAVLLLLGAMVISSMTYHLGMPRGRGAFLLSLACADALWVLWHRSFVPIDYGFALSVIRTNLAVLAPFAAIAFASWSWPPLARGGRRLFRRVFRGSGRTSEEMAEEMERYQALHASLESSLLRDIIGAGGGRVELSAGTKRLAAEMSVLAGEMADGKKDRE